MSLPCERGRWISSFLAVDVNFSGDPRFLIREDLTLDLPSNVDGSWLFQSSMPIVACGNQTWFVRKSWNITSFIDDFPIKSFAVVVGKFPLLCLTECTLVFFRGIDCQFHQFHIKNQLNLLKSGWNILHFRWQRSCYWAETTPWLTSYQSFKGWVELKIFQDSQMFIRFWSCH